MTIIHAVILGLVEGITEFLPISSTGHLILASQALGIQQTEFVKSFEIVIQLGAILAVVVLFWKKIWNREIDKRVLAAFLPTAALGLIFYKPIKQYLLGSTSVVLWSLLVGGIVLIAFEFWYKKKTPTIADVGAITYHQAALVGLFQSLAMIPGVSRSAATIVGGMLLGMHRSATVEFSFLLAIPTMAAATGLDLLKSGWTFSPTEWTLLAVGFITSFAAALAAIKFFLSFIKRHTFIPFGIYRVFLVVIVWLFLQ